MYTCKWMFGAVLLWTLAGLCNSQHTNITCENFKKGPRFDPFQIVDSKWRIIYFYSDTIEIRPIIFSLIAKKRLDKFKTVVDALDPNLGVDWNKATFMMEPKPGVQVVLIYMGSPGAFRGIVKVEQRAKEPQNPEPLLKLADLRFKLKDRYMGMMCCEDMTAFVLARNDEVPSSEEECELVCSTMQIRASRHSSEKHIVALTRGAIISILLTLLFYCYYYLRFKSDKLF